MAERPTAADYLRTLKTAVPTMVSQISELAKAEIKPSLKHGGIGTGLFGAAGVIGATVIAFFMLTGGFLFSMIYAEVLERHPLTALTLGFLTMSVIGLLIIAVLVFIGWRQFKRVKAPEATIAETKASLAAIESAIESGITDVSQQRLPVVSPDFLAPRATVTDDDQH